MSSEAENRKIERTSSSEEESSESEDSAAATTVLATATALSATLAAVALTASTALAGCEGERKMHDQYMLLYEKSREDKCSEELAVSRRGVCERKSRKHSSRARDEGRE